MFQEAGSLIRTKGAKAAVTDITSVQFNYKLHGTHVNTAINVDNKNFCSGEIVFTRDWNIIFSLNLIFGSIFKKR